MENSHSKSQISAIIFDLDGTLLNTEQLRKNVLKELLAKYGKVEDKEKEKKKLGMGFKEAALGVLNDYDLPLTFEQYVEEISQHEGWKEKFAAILGSDQVKSGKPSPDIVGVKAGKAAGMNVVAVPSLEVESDSFSISDSILHSLLEFQPEQWGLPPFLDWVGDALPVEPIRLAGVFSNGILQTYSDVLPDHIWGIYIGWAKFDGWKVLKSVIGIDWKHTGFNPDRKIQLHIIDGSDVDKYANKMQIVLIGYLRRSCSLGYLFNNLEILDEDKMSAQVALNLPAFSLKSCKSYFLGDVEDVFGPGETELFEDVVA